MRKMGSLNLVVVLLLLAGCRPSDDAVDTDCETASLETVPVVNDASKCLGETDPENLVGTDVCLVKMRNAIELMERAEEMCSGEVLTEIRLIKASFVEQISIVEKSQAYYRGEIDADEMFQTYLDKWKRDSSE